MLCPVKDIISHLKRYYDVSTCGIFPQYIRDLKKLPRDAGAQLSEDCLYACTANDLKDVELGSLKNVPLLCAVGQDYSMESSMLGTRSIIIVKNVFLPDLLMCLAQGMFGMGTRQAPLSEVRHDLLMCHEPREILKTCYKYLKLPAFLTTVTLRILCSTESIEVNPITEMYAEEGCFSSKLRKASNRPQAVAATASEDNLFFTERLDESWTLFSYPLYEDNGLSGYILVFSKAGVLDETQESICRLLRNILEQELPRISAAAVSQLTETGFIETLIKEKLTREEEISERLAKLNWKPKPYMQLIVPSMNGLLPAKSLRQSARLFAQELPDMKVFPLDAGIIILYDGAQPLYSGAMPSWLTRLGEFLNAGGLEAGISGSFGSFTELRSAYFQAQKAVSVGTHIKKNRNLHFYEDVVACHMMEFTANYLDLSLLLPTGFDRLLELDKSEGKELILTLETYLDCGCSVNQCAEALYIHVNTVKYRMKQISEILHCSFKDGDSVFRAAMGVRILRYIENCRYLQHPYSPLQGQHIGGVE